MSASASLGDRDLRALWAVVEEGLRDAPGPAMPWVVLDMLLRLVPCDEIDFSQDFTEQNVRTHHPFILQGVEDGPGRVIWSSADWWRPHYSEFWAHRGQFLPCTYPERSGDVASVLRWSDFYTAAELKSEPYYAECLGPIGDKHAVYVHLSTSRDRPVFLGFYRKSGRDFTERDRLVLHLLRPHLREVYLDAERRRHGVPHLSRREKEVLQLASQGYSNADIARALFISGATVAKHMEHIFDRTGVRTRSAAAALALPSPLSLRPPHRK